MSPYDPNADFYASTPTASRAPQHPASQGFGAPRLPSTPHYAPAAPAGRTPVPTWAKVLIVLGCLIVAAPVVVIGASIGIPVFLNQRANAVDAQVKEDLGVVARAQEDFRMVNGFYAADPADLGIAEPASAIGVAPTDGRTFCLQGHDAEGRGHVWFYSSSNGLSRTPCA